ncbi:porin family protein [Mucilaginibacter sp. AW1-7]|jgi:hypothetical protein|uniref:porin family protein n=1 Tax=unclassified Mucilaginibacter TaxID=2617802 RepID=UPI0008C04096|nr:porin family protein [Mucilaginibacter sp. OK283]SEO06277.1 Outer membrane protein beta-barrel domain-containing protein [Mucilaginibacter sp. OK283]
MKKYLLSAALLIAVSISAQAQFSLGVKGGVNFSKINTSAVGESSVTGYQAGLFARVGSGLYLQPELYLASKGGKFDFQATDGTTVTTEGKVKFTTLNVPLLLGKSFGAKNLNFRVMAGPVYSYALDKNQSFSDNVNGAYQDFGNYNKSTLGFQAGAGVDIGAITADLRYEGGLSKVNSNYGQRQNLWALSVGFKIL